MEFKHGMWVRNPQQPVWGVGKVLSHEEHKVRVLFLEVGEKLLDTQFVTLEEAKAPADASIAVPQLRAVTRVDTNALERLCHLFHEQFKGRRSSTDDGWMAMKVLQDMKTRGDLTRATARQLFSWCHTGGSYVEGVDLAQRICRLIYGRVPTAAEIELAGF